MFHPRNRLGEYFDPAPSDRLIQSAYAIELKLLRYTGDEPDDIDTIVSYEIHGQLDEADAPLLAKLLAEFKAPPAGKAGAQ